MEYRNVVSSSVAPVSSTSTHFSVDALESILTKHFVVRDSRMLNILKSCYLRSSSTFLKDLFSNIENIFNETSNNNEKKIIIALAIDTIEKQIQIIEQLIPDINKTALDAIICGTFLKFFKKNISC